MNVPLALRLRVSARRSEGLQVVERVPFCEWSRRYVEERYSWGGCTDRVGTCHVTGSCSDKANVVFFYNVVPFRVTQHDRRSTGR